MTDREKKLAAAVVLILLLWGGWSAWQRYRGAMAARKTDLQNAESELQAARFAKLRAMDAAERLERYRERSLPTDLQAAQREYRAWLFDRLEEAGLEFDGVTLVDSRPGAGAYTSLRYSAEAAGDLAAVTRFLDAFYRAPMLHKITTLKLTPRERSTLKVNLGVRVLAVAGATRKAGLPEGDSGRPALPDADAYVASIVPRDIFREYTPPPPPRRDPPPRPVVKRDPPPPRPRFDESNHAYLTGIVQSGDRLQAWINVRTAGETLRVFAGDELAVGLLKGTVESVSARRLVYRTDAGRFATPLGKTLRQADELGEIPGGDAEVEALESADGVELPL
ncbi:MAG: hypothetical protein AAF790_09685 [Planctomycetota bacterium]